MWASCNKQSAFILKLHTKPITKPFFSVLVKEFFLKVLLEPCACFVWTKPRDKCLRKFFGDKVTTEVDVCN